jgi:2-polyprenyl-6-hydroxyphenyl methylase/3-demethylubiquinone-9 3-methyltransferase
MNNDEPSFAFGANWRRFLGIVDERRIEEAERSLCEMLGIESLEGMRFLDIGSGSGLFSLAARRLGANVHSFDYDDQSVACAGELKRRYRPGDQGWVIERGSALDGEYLRRLGTFDIVYSWGVLHHTGHMWRTLELAITPLAQRGLLFIAIYNDQGWISRYWTIVKRLYNSNAVARAAMIALHAPYLVGLRWLVRMLRQRGRLPRGMTYWYDTLDWLGGFPFEVASPQAIEDFYSQHGLAMVRRRLCGRRHGCNEFVLTRLGNDLTMAR